MILPNINDAERVKTEFEYLFEDKGRASFSIIQLY